MDFPDTGLPSDPAIFKAFQSYVQSTLSSKDPRRNDGGYSLRTAQLLQQHLPGDVKLTTAALLVTMPPSTHGLVGKRFGEEVSDIVSEITRHQQTHYRHISRASEAAKIIFMAGAVISFEEYKAAVKDADQELDKMELTGNKGAILLPEMNIAVYRKIEKAFTNNTSVPALEKKYSDMLDDVEGTGNTLRERIRSINQQDADPLAGIFADAANNPEDISRPFEETALLDDPLVRQTYAFALEGSQKRPILRDLAIITGELLSKHTPDPVTIAAALVDVACPELDPEDFSFLEDELGPGVVSVLRDHSVHRPGAPGKALQASLEFRQIFLAYETTALGNLLDESRDLFNELADQLSPQEKREYLQNMVNDLQQSGALINPLLGTTQLHGLEDQYRDIKREIVQLIRDVSQKPPQNNGPRP